MLVVFACFIQVEPVRMGLSGAGMRKDGLLLVPRIWVIMSAERHSTLFGYTLPVGKSVGVDMSDCRHRVDRRRF